MRILIQLTEEVFLHLIYYPLTELIKCVTRATLPR